MYYCSLLDADKDNMFYDNNLGSISKKVVLLPRISEMFKTEGCK